MNRHIVEAGMWALAIALPSLFSRIGPTPGHVLDVIFPGLTFAFLAIATRKSFSDSIHQNHYLAGVVGSAGGAIAGTSLPFVIIWFYISFLDAGGGVPIGLGFLLLAMPFYTIYLMSLGYAKGQSYGARKWPYR